MESFRQALAAGAECVELDVHLSADGVVVVMHDPRLDRTTDTTGVLSELPIERIRAADAGARYTHDGLTFPYRGRGLRVPTFEEVLRDLGDVPLLIEVKTSRASAETRRLIEQYGAAARCVVEAFDARALAPFRGSGIAVGASSRDVRRLLHRVVTRRRPRTLPYRVMCLPPRIRGMRVPIASLVRLAARPRNETLGAKRRGDGAAFMPPLHHAPAARHERVCLDGPISRTRRRARARAPAPPATPARTPRPRRTPRAP